MEIGIEDYKIILLDNFYPLRSISPIFHINQIMYEIF